MKKIALLGGLTPQDFLRDYWHKKPLLIRNAVAQMDAIAPADLFALASQEEVESRLITHFNQRWQLESGPFARLPATSKKAWTLLVQGVNLHDDSIDTLMQQFRFIPDARLDDLMISYATDTGGVGPHFDSYDVFLLQAKGQRRWRISAQKDLSLVEGLPLKILKNFKAEQEFVLEPGDMLYLPPHYAHDGVAVGECMTYSIGFRAPSYQELGESFLNFMSDSIDLPGRYADPDLAASKHPAEISRAMLTRIAAELNKIRFTDDDITLFLGEYLTEPKHHVVFRSPEKTLSAKRFADAAAKRGIRLSRMSRMMYRGKHVFINGESFSVGREDKLSLVTLADARRLDGEEMRSVTQDVLESLYVWYQDGWIELN